MKTPNFDTSIDYSQLGKVRAEIREFLRNDPASAKPRADCWSHFDAAFSGRLGRAGFIGMTWPKRYGGAERSSLERYVVVEELLAAGAPAAPAARAPMQARALAKVESPGQALERIAELRKQGRDEEADKALAEFRKRYPDFKIPDEMLKRVEKSGTGADFQNR